MNSANTIYKFTFHEFRHHYFQENRQNMFQFEVTIHCGCMKAEKTQGYKLELNAPCLLSGD